jgi:hypothetical protein
MKILKRVVISRIELALAGAMLLLSTASVVSADEPQTKSLGLQGGPNATVLKDGRPYRGIGVNYFDCFLRTWKNGDDTSYDAGFAVLAAKGIPFARFCATGFWPRDMQLYREDRAEYFRRLDGVVNSARKHGIGLVPSLFWYYACVPDLVGEPMDQWANPRSKTRAWMRDYVREVAARYRDDPAIWAWELGNEFSLRASLPNGKHHRCVGPPSFDNPFRTCFEIARLTKKRYGSMEFSQFQGRSHSDEMYSEVSQRFDLQAMAENLQVAATAERTRPTAR